MTGPRPKIEGNRINRGALKKNGQQGAVDSRITTDAGDVVPIRMNFVKGVNGWEINSIEQFVPIRRDDQ